MSRQFPLLGIVMTVALVVPAGCHPQQPFYFFEDGDLSHYLDVATEMEYPDVEQPRLAEVEGSMRPLSLENPGQEEEKEGYWDKDNKHRFWELKLEDAIHHALANSKVMRSIGGQIQGMPDFLARSPDLATTVYDPAIVETNPRSGIEAALAGFDAQFTSSVFWEKNDTPRNNLAFPGAQEFFPRLLRQDVGSFQAQLSKTAATGGTWSLTHNVQYDKQNTSRLFSSDWNVNLEAEFRQPLLQGAGVQYNRIAGPGAIPGWNNGVEIARMNTDIALADFEAGVRNLVSDVEVAYWELYYAWRYLDAMKKGRDSGRRTLYETNVKYELGGGLLDLAQAKNQYFAFRGAMEQAKHDLYAAESKLRYMLGLAATDGRLIRPQTKPKLAKWSFDEELFRTFQQQALSRSVELRKQRWNVKKRELELVSAKNYLLPRLDAVGRYRWRGMGDHLINANNTTGNAFNNAYQSMTTGDYQEWHLGLELSFPLGFRKEMAGVRHAQLNLARERAKLQELELEVTHQLSYAIRELKDMHTITQTNFNRRIAAKEEYDVNLTLQTVGEAVMSDVLDANRRLAEAESAYYRSLVDYNKAIAQVHFRKGTLLDYDGVYLTEGPWPGKAYFDAHRRARARDASFYLDYGFTRPPVISRGPVPVEQEIPVGPVLVDGGAGVDRADQADGTGPEFIPTPKPEAMDAPAEPSAPEPQPDPQASRPKIGTPQAAVTRLSQKPSPSTSTKRSYDLGKLNLGQLGGKPAGEESATAGAWSAVDQASYQQPVTRTRTDNKTDNKTDNRKNNDTKRSHLKWSDSGTSGTRHESVANPQATETDRSASGWKGVQR